MPTLVTYLNWTPIFEWYVVQCGSKNNGIRHGFQLKDFSPRKDWIACSEYDNHFRFNNQHNWGDHLNRWMRIFTLMMDKMFIRAPKIMMWKWLKPQFGIANHLILIVCCHPWRSELGKGKYSRPIYLTQVKSGEMLVPYTRNVRVTSHMS